MGWIVFLIKDLENQQDMVLGNIYRLHHDNSNVSNIHTFVTELDPMFSSVTNINTYIVITADFNINLLQINVVYKERFV